MNFIVDMGFIFLERLNVFLQEDILVVKCYEIFLKMSFENSSSIFFGL
jgi:hypothetical protein